MKLARLDTIEREDILFVDGEPDSRYFVRQVLAVADSYDFESNNATDISSIPNWIKYFRKAGSRQNAIIYMQDVISDWSTHDQDEKDLFLGFAVETINPCLNASQKSDIESLIYEGFTIFTNGGSNVKESWNGTTWV